MAFERQWPAVAPQIFTSDGGISGQVRIDSSYGFRVGAKVVIVAVGQQTLNVKVKRVIDKNLIVVGPIDSPYSKAEWTNLSDYTVSAGAYIYAEAQDKAKIPHNDREDAMYESEPVVARRVIQVDQLGSFYSDENPVPVKLASGSVTVDNLEVYVALSHLDTILRPHDSVRIGGASGDELVINPDGSINVQGLDLSALATEATLQSIDTNLAALLTIFQPIAPFLVDGSGNNLTNNNGINLTEFP